MQTHFPRLSIHSKIISLSTAIVLTLAGCDQMLASKSDTASLYNRLGGQPAIVAVVDKFVANVAADSRINSYFAKTDIPHFKAELVDQICEATGGPCVYTGDDMVTAHKGLGISNADFNALGEDLAAALDHFNVPEQEKGELLGALGAMQGDIVEE